MTQNDANALKAVVMQLKGSNIPVYASQPHLVNHVNCKLVWSVLLCGTIHIISVVETEHDQTMSARQLEQHRLLLSALHSMQHMFTTPCNAPRNALCMQQTFTCLHVELILQARLTLLPVSRQPLLHVLVRPLPLLLRHQRHLVNTVLTLVSGSQTRRCRHQAG